MDKNDITWSKVIRKAAKELEIGILTMVRRIALYIITSAIKRTPVGEFDGGDLRRAWNISLNSPEFITEPGQAGKMTLGKLEGIFPTVHITNGLPYAAVVEYGLYPGVGERTTTGTNPETGTGIFSIGAPQGMLEVTLMKLMNNLRTVADGRIGGY